MRRRLAKSKKLKLPWTEPIGTALSGIVHLETCTLCTNSNVAPETPDP